MNGTLTDKPVSWLVEDEDMYPRTVVDNANVSSIAESIRSGNADDIPPIVAMTDGRIVDGFHRRRAWIRVHGDGVVVPVLVVEYADDAEAFADAVRRNASHGRKLNSNDETRSALRLADLGVDDVGIASILRISVSKVEKLSVRVAVGPSNEAVPLKRGDIHLMGRRMSQAQVEALGHRLGVPYGRLARQILDGLREDILPDDESTWATLRDLRDAIDTGLAGRAQSRAS